MGAAALRGMDPVIAFQARSRDGRQLPLRWLRRRACRAHRRDLDAAGRPVLVGDRQDVAPSRHRCLGINRLDLRNRRSDFLAAEMTAGSELYYWEKHRRAGNIVYRMTVLERSPARTVVATENWSPVRFLLPTLFEPGELQSFACIELVSPGVWGVYLLTRAGQGVSALAVGHDASYVNRAAAIYRHLAGIPTDEEPPAAP